jgi:tetratricopeptide (TPR) repeat protein
VLFRHEPACLRQVGPTLPTTAPVGSSIILSMMSDRFDAFVSYARADGQDLLPTLLRGLPGHLRLWYDRESLPNRGLTFDAEIRRAIESSTRLILLFGPGAAASEYVRQEWTFADDLGIPIIPVLLAGGYDSLPDALQHYHAVDARDPRKLEDVGAELTRLLAEAVLRPGPCYDFPFRTPNELVREPLQDRLWEALGLDRQKPTDAGRGHRAAALHGLPGSGKSTAAATFGRSIRCRRAFPEGIVWARCGMGFEQLAGARHLISRIAPGSSLPEDDSGVQQALTEALRDKGILLILDDVHEASAVAPFLQAAGPGVRGLVTCLDPKVATVLGAVPIEVEKLDDESARRLLSSWTGGFLPEEADPVLAECDGLPFALAITGAMIRDGVPWTRVIQWFESRRLDLIETAFPGYEHGTLLRAVSASFEALASQNQRAAAAWVELAAFHPGALLTEQVIFRLWCRPGGLPREDAASILSLLERRLLIQARTEAGVVRLTLHKLLADFIGLKCPNTVELQSALIESYRRSKGDRDWSELKDDGYVFDHLLGHLEALGLDSELVSAINREWVRKQFDRSGDLGQGLDDVKLAMRIAARPPIDFAKIADLAMLSGQIVSGIRGAPKWLIGAVAAIGDSVHAVRWAADQPDPDRRFDCLVLVAEELIARGEIALARKVIRNTAESIPKMGKVIETGLFSGLTALNAVHAIVHFPWTDQWEGTTNENVALARIPLDAVCRLARVAWQADTLQTLALVRHPFWELYGDLIPLAAVEQLAEQGQRDVAEVLLDAIVPPATDDTSDPANAAAYRRVVALAAVGRFEVAIPAIESLNKDYRSVASCGVAKHLAAAKRMPEAVALLGAMEDDLAQDEAIADIVDIADRAADPESCRHLGMYLLKQHMVIPGAWVLAAGGEPEFGMSLLDRDPGEELLLGLGARLGVILAQTGHMDLAVSVAKRLVPAAERLCGHQWFAPETIDVEPRIAQAARALLALLARTGQPLPEGVMPLSLIFETNNSYAAPFKLDLIVELSIAGRFSDALSLVEVSGFPSGRALYLSTILSVGGHLMEMEQLTTVAEDLRQTMETTPDDASLDRPLSAAMRALIGRGRWQEADRLSGMLLSRPGLRSAVGVWAFEKARAGDTAAVWSLIPQLFRSLEDTGTPDSSRALMITALASRQQDTTGLAEVEQILSDARIAAGSLDIVFEVVSLYMKAGMKSLAAAFATGVPGGKAGEAADTFEREGSVRYEGLTHQELDVVFFIRAVAAASMTLAAKGGGTAEEAEEWLGKALEQYRRFREAARVANVGDSAKYIAAAEVAIRGESSELTDRGVRLITAWLLWEYGHHTTAAQVAAQGLSSLENSFDGLPQTVTTEMYERHHGVNIAARGGLAAILAMQFANEGKMEKARELVREEEGRYRTYGWSALSPGERSEVYAYLAIASHACGNLDSALKYLRAAIEPAPILATRGDMSAFPNLVRALARILPPDNAARFWVQWLVAAAAKGSKETGILLSILIRHVREEDIARVKVGRAGSLIRRDMVDEVQRQRSDLYDFFGMSAGALRGS